MKEYFFVMLIRGENAPEFSKEELAEIQAGHMDNIHKMSTDGVLQFAGPFGGEDDWRGIFILDIESLEAAEALLKEDPAVKAGLLKYRILPWWGAKGAKLR